MASYAMAAAMVATPNAADVVGTALVAAAAVVVAMVVCMVVVVVLVVAVDVASVTSLLRHTHDLWCAWRAAARTPCNVSARPSIECAE